jgi:L-amino acid N-acyltransferase YncA
MDFAIDAMSPADWPEVRAIYLEGIATRNATFETVAPTWEAWDAAHRPERLVARAGPRVLGWAALSPCSARLVYAGVAEVGIYVAASARGKGVGRALLAALIDASERSGVWTLQAGVFPENTASIELHRGHGFRDVGRRERIGRLGDVWRDVILLERRSRVVGGAPGTGGPGAR